MARMRDFAAALQEVEEKKKMKEKDARRLVGILIYSASAFEWDPQDQTWWARTMEPLSDSYKGANFQWTDECRKSFNTRTDGVHGITGDLDQVMMENSVSGYGTQ